MRNSAEYNSIVQHRWNVAQPAEFRAIKSYFMVSCAFTENCCSKQTTPLSAFFPLAKCSSFYSLPEWLAFRGGGGTGDMGEGRDYAIGSTKRITLHWLKVWAMKKMSSISIFIGKITTGKSYPQRKEEKTCEDIIPQWLVSTLVRWHRFRIIYTDLMRCATNHYVYGLDNLICLLITRGNLASFAFFSGFYLTIVVKRQRENIKQQKVPSWKVKTEDSARSSSFNSQKMSILFTNRHIARLTYSFDR